MPSRIVKKAPKKAKPKKRKTKKLKRKTRQLRSDCRLTEELIVKVTKIVQVGNFRTTAFAWLGIPRDTWHRWVAFGNKELREFSSGAREPKDLTLYAELVLNLDRAEGRATKDMVSDITKAKTEDGRKDVRAREWFLERRFNKLFSRNPNAIVDGERDDQEEPRGREILLGKILIALGRHVGGDDDA